MRNILEKYTTRRREIQLAGEGEGELDTAIMQNMIFDAVFKVDSVLENKSDLLSVADSILNKRI